MDANAVFDSLDGQHIDVEKHYTRNGERLEISIREEDASIRLDALGLESLSWQNIEELGQEFGTGEKDRIVTDEVVIDSDDSVRETLFTITNEFATVEVAKATIQEREYLEIQAPRAGFTIYLPSSILAAIAREGSDLVTRFLGTPPGPNPEHH
jgi:hypothetical protein